MVDRKNLANAARLRGSGCAASAREAELPSSDRGIHGYRTVFGLRSLSRAGFTKFSQLTGNFGTTGTADAQTVVQSLDCSIGGTSQDERYQDG
jgi:hypothetical protein